MRIAHLARLLRLPGIWGNDEHPGIQRRFGNGQHHVGEIHAGEDLHMVAFDHLIRKLAAHIGLGLIIGLDHLDLAPTQRAAGGFQAEIETVEQFLAEHTAGAGEGGDKANLDRRIGGIRRDHKSSCHRGSKQQTTHFIPPRHRCFAL